MTHWTPDLRAARVDALFALAPVLPVLSIERIEDAVPLASALVEAGLSVLEVTLRTPIALEAIRRIVREVPGAHVGAGTVLGAIDLAAVAAAGAEFAIAPGATDALYAAAEDAAIPFIPAIATASELMRGMEHGHTRFKFFPAESAGGVGALRAFAGPFPHVRFCPTGGIDATSAPRYLALGNVATVGGSWMVPQDAVLACNWERIGQLARQASALRDVNQADG
jgi:2-dehydro-3-deoxyphosphogluconate aldolase/(4S)-4-hydroxy-2-oxoglutarate aldolase